MRGGGRRVRGGALLNKNIESFCTSGHCGLSMAASVLPPTSSFVPRARWCSSGCGKIYRVQPRNPQPHNQDGYAAESNGPHKGGPDTALIRKRCFWCPRGAGIPPFQVQAPWLVDCEGWQTEGMTG